MIKKNKKLELTKNTEFGLKRKGKIVVNKEELFDLYLKVRELHERSVKFEEDLQETRLVFLKLVRKK